MQQARCNNLDLRICEAALAAADLAARLVEQRVAARPNVVLGLATGTTFRPVYRRLVEAWQAGSASFSAVTTFNLDEYIGLRPDESRSFHSYMDEVLFSQVDIDRRRTHLPDGASRDPARAAAAYEAAIAAAGGIDFQLLGIGGNGHIGFNEPGSPPASRTRVVTLSPATLAANRAEFGGGAVPRRALTMGIATILEADEIVLLATGSEKAAALARAVAGPVDEDCPASFLQGHGKVTVICDRAAAESLPDACATQISAAERATAAPGSGAS